VALGLHGGFSKKECGYNFYRTLLTAMNGVFAVVILASALQRLSGNVRPTFLSICPNACLWPETTFRLSDMLEDVKNCYNASVLEETTKSRHLKELLVETRSSFPSLQESLSTFCTVFVTGLWHRKHTRKVGHLIATLLLSIMCLLVFLLANGKLTRHENWIQDIVGGCLLGIIVALHQLICLFGMDVEQEKKGKTNIASMEEVQMKQIVIPRVRYRGSLIHRKRSSSGVMNPCFVGVQPC
jgi:membrane-associated phospholipid phosphatase